MTMSKEKPAVLVIDDEEDLRLTLSSILKKDYSPQLAASGKEGLKLLKGRSFALVLLDIRMPEMDGLTVLKKIKEMDNSLPVIMVTASQDVKSAVEAMKAGAEDFISKPFEVEELLAVIEKVVEKSKLRKENQYLKEVLKDAESYGDLIGQTPQIKKIMSLISQVAITDSTILITGESGTGKEIAAKAIHKLSKRKNGPFVALNCGAIPENLLESELFGHERGAFTGALDRRIGKFELSDGGTIFLDEIGDMSPPLQAKLLRVLQEKEYDPLGSVSPRKTNVRIIAATNKDLSRLVSEGKFRDDLYYRVNVVKIELPLLSQRREDIPLLIDAFINKFNARMEKQITGVNDHALRRLMSYEYPGNVRELENIIEHAFVICRENRIDLDCLPREILQAPEGEYSQVSRQDQSAFGKAEADVIARTLRKHGGNRLRAADELGIDRTTLWRKMHKYGLA